MFVVGVVWFALASLLCGVAQDVETLVAARVLQGVGGALLTPASLALIHSSFRVQDRAPAIGLWSGLGGVAGAIGPFVGGTLVELSWRWVFLVNLPVAAGVVAAGFSPLVAGLALLPVTAAMLLLSGRAGALAARRGPRLLMIAGPLTSAAGVLLLRRIGAARPARTRHFRRTVAARCCPWALVMTTVHLACV